MLGRTPHTLESATSDLVHLIKEGFFPFCMADGLGSVAILLVEDRESFGVLTTEAHKLLNAGATIEQVHDRAMVEKLWFDLNAPLTAERLVRRTALLLVRQAA